MDIQRELEGLKDFSYSRKESFDFLKDKGFSEDEINEALDQVYQIPKLKPVEYIALSIGQLFIGTYLQYVISSYIRRLRLKRDYNSTEDYSDYVDRSFAVTHYLGLGVSFLLMAFLIFSVYKFYKLAKWSIILWITLFFLGLAAAIILTFLGALPFKFSLAIIPFASLLLSISIRQYNAS